MTLGSVIGFTPDLMEQDHQEAMLSAAAKLLTHPAFLKAIWPGAYDHLIDKKGGKSGTLNLAEVEMIVMPLDRIGAPAGESGARIFIVYFAHKPPNGKAGDVLASPPLVMKLGLPDKLNEEFVFQRKWPTLTDDVRARLALPIDLFPTSGKLGVLSAPFRSYYRAESHGQRHGVSVSDLWGLLRTEQELDPAGGCDTTMIGRYLDDALELMSRVHRNNHGTYARTKATYRETYGWYLRNTYAAPDSGTGNAHLIAGLFGNEVTIERFGETWPHPTKIIAKLFDGDGESFSGAFGPVHGDLHPKNIVVGQGNAIHAIDFGWAHHHRHLLVDYLLLDLNLRAVTLPPHVSEADCLCFGRFLGPDDIAAPPPSIAGRAGLIQKHIWTRLKIDGIVHDWRTEYLIPLFIVGYGLLVHLGSARNQTAMLATVLATGRKIDESWP